MAEEIKTLRRQCTYVKAQLTRIRNSLNDSISSTAISIKKAKLEEVYHSFNKLHLELARVDETGDYENSIVEFESSYYACAEVLDNLQNSNKKSASTTSDQAKTLTNASVVLPRIDLPTFDGNLLEWQSFYDTFKAMVHENEDILGVQKFHYLKHSLRGEIAGVINTLNASYENYTVAWTMLIKRCNQPRKIIQMHLKSLFELPNLTKECPVALRSMITATEKHVNALKAIKIPVEAWNEILVYVVTAKLDKITRRHWDRSLDDDAMPTLAELLHFLSKFARDDALTTLANSPEAAHTQSNVRQYQKPAIQDYRVKTTRQTYITAQAKVKCPICTKGHYIQSCEKFLNLSVDNRFNAAKTAKLCINCLKSGQSCTACYSSTCKKCHRKHNTLLHREENNDSNTITPSTSAPAEQSRTTLTACLPSEVLLSTACLFISDIEGTFHECRVLLDSASQVNFITTDLAKKLRLSKTNVDIPVSGFNQLETRIRTSVTAIIASKHSAYKSEITLYVAPQISGYLPSQQISHSHVQLPKNVPLADPQYYKPAKIDALLGAELFYQLMRVGQIRLSAPSLILQKTALGWVLSGAVSSKGIASKSVKCNLSSIPLDKQLAKFWEMEECATIKPRSKEEELCEDHFKIHTRRDVSGRYVVRLPFNQSKTKLGSSYGGALKRFYALEKRLEQDASLKSEYSKFLQEYHSLGHMTDISKIDNINEGYYLPHHAIFKQSSLTTKLRVVFDASAKTSTGLSLNETLLIGPTIQDDLFSLLVRFRSYNYVLTADAEKMYRQVRLHERDAIYQKILWRETQENPLQTFRLDTVTYGTASAPFLAIRALHKLVEDEGKPYPLASIALTKDCYVDDLLTGATTYKDAIQLRDELIRLTNLGKFHLRKWSSNDPTLIEDLAERSLDSNHALNSNDLVKTLGVYWNSSTDTITYSIAFDKNHSRVTKRSILSSVAQLFDPLGLVGPVITKAKIVMQDLWKANVEWDESVPQDIYLNWKEFQQQLPLLSKFEAPRKIVAGLASDIQLHGFCDASEKAYGACVYIRSCRPDGTITVQLVASKSRVAPVKSVSIPRLELCAAVLLTKLYSSIKGALRLKFNSIRFWTDSTIALCWINTPPHTLKTFVANRVSKIQEHTEPGEWFHVASLDNPADAISRGQTPVELLKNPRWHQGPLWLRETEKIWPVTRIPLTNIPELRPVTVLKTTHEIDIFNRFSTINRLKRVVAYCLRFYTNATRKADRRGPLDAEELNRAHDRIIRMVQEHYFTIEINDLKTRNHVSKTSKILNLNPFVDEQSILRVGGRLHNSDLEFQQRHPILLPRAQHITKLIIRENHLKTYHGGIQTTLNAVRQTYWVIDGKNTTRHIIRNCITCFRARPSSVSAIMGNLPKNRVVQARPFESVGIDYCGPLYIKEKKFRNRTKVKAYVAVFVCFATKAAHLELVTDLTTEAFIGCLKRFFARRGKSRHIYSDNATNFVGAKNELSEIQRALTTPEHNTKILNYLSNEGITWHFSPPRSPHFGGLWEALVKSFKHHLIRIVGDQLFTYEYLNTYVIEIEAILNSRPLTPMSSDPNDTNALTPAHLLIGDSLMSMPERNLQQIATNRLSMWQHIQRVKQHFWAKWHKEYINQLNTRSKWRTSRGKALAIGDLVILKEDHVPSMKWILGRITDLHPGGDSIVRVVTVKTAHGTYKRSITRLCPLPTEDL